MTQHTSVRLSGALRSAAEAFFRVDLGDVTVHRGAACRECGATAFALGSRIYLPEEGRLAPLAELELLGHELTHVVQQRQGRVRPGLVRAGYAANDDAALEREALAEGRRFARGEESRLAPLPVSLSHAPVLQRSVTVGSEPLTGDAALSPAGAAVIGLVDGGWNWLNWAIGNPAVNYHFADERRLLVGMQSGLHGHELMLLRGLGLLVHPLRLMELQADDLKVLAAVENETGPNSVTEMQARKTLAKYQLLSQTELAIGTEFLAQAGVAEAPLFQAMRLAHRVALFQLVDGATSELSLNPMIQKEAAAFAVLHAQAPEEFVDYYRFYMSTVDDAEPQAKMAPARSRKAEAGLDALGTLLYGMLFCPAVEGLPSPEQMNVIVQNWVAPGNNLGFSRLSLALAQIGQYADLKGATGEAAMKAVEQYMDQAERCILQLPAASITLSQDGGDYTYSYDNAPALAEICLAGNGNVTLATYQPKK